MQPIHWFIVLVVFVLLFGAKRLPDTAKSVGESLKIFKKTLSDDDEKDEDKKDAPQVTSQSTDAAPPPSTQTRADEPNRSEL